MAPGSEAAAAGHLAQRKRHLGLAGLGWVVWLILPASPGSGRPEACHLWGAAGEEAVPKVGRKAPGAWEGGRVGRRAAAKGQKQMEHARRNTWPAKRLPRFVTCCL